MMRTSIAVLLSLLLIGTSLANEPIPDRVARLLKAIPKIDKKENRDTLFERLGLLDDSQKKKIRLLESDDHWGVASRVWSVSEDGLWFLVEAFQPFQLEKDGKTLKRGSGNGQLLSFQLYKRTDKAEDLDLDKLKPIFPYFSLGKHYPEQGGADQPAIRLESKSEGKDKPQPEAEGRPQ